MKSLLRFAMVSGLLAALGGAAFAQTATYTFEAPAFVNGTTSANGGLLNKAPNSGTSGALASFTSAPNTNAIQINDNGNGVNTPTAPPLASPQFTGQYLNSIDSNQTITVTFTGAGAGFTDLSLDFYLSDPGALNFNSGSGGSASVTGVYDTGTTNYIGTLNFSGATPFTSFTLVTAGTGGGSAPLSFGIDNLRISAVPAPGSALVLGMGMLYPLAGLARRRKSKPV